MTKPAAHCLLAAMVGLLTACASPKICTREIRKSEPAAVALLNESQRAHRRTAFTKAHDLSVRYEGRWASIGPRFQPVLLDTRFRRGSEERLIVGPRIMAQEHTGPEGKKLVLRVPGKVSVACNGALSNDAETQRAAALVADACTLFLLGPFYFDRPGITLATNGAAIVDKAVCDEVLAVLRPGFGEAEEVRVILFIGRTSNLQLAMCSSSRSSREAATTATTISGVTSSSCSRPASTAIPTSKSSTGNSSPRMRAGTHRISALAATSTSAASPLWESFAHSLPRI